MPEEMQILRFAVGTADGPRSRTWRLWVPSRKSDVYISGRRLGSSVKVSLHEPGPSRFAVTKEWVRRTGFVAPAGRDQRLAVEWEQPRPSRSCPIARAFTIIVPWDEILDRDKGETGEVVWIRPPSEDTCIHFDVVYTPACAEVIGHPGAESMGTGLVGEVRLENKVWVFVTWLQRPMLDVTRQGVTKLRSAPIRDSAGKLVGTDAVLSFGTEPNPDSNDGTYVGVFVDVTRVVSPATN